MPSASTTAKITIPAVKITGTEAAPAAADDADAVPTSNEDDVATAAPEDSTGAAPDPVGSTWNADVEDLLQVALDPIDASLFPVVSDDSTDLAAEDEFGEFLMDAVDWL